MKLYTLLFFLIFNIPLSVFACMFDHEIEKSDLKQYPLIAYLNEDADNIYFCLYLKDDGNFGGLDEVYINIESEISDSIYSGYKDITKHGELPNLFHIGFSVKKVNIPYVTIGIMTSEVDVPPVIGENYSTTGHTIHYLYWIKLKDIFDTFSKDGTSWDMNSNPNKYKDEKLDQLLKTTFEKNRDEKRKKFLETKVGKNRDDDL